jgi:hypothetical protein
MSPEVLLAGAAGALAVFFLNLWIRTSERNRESRAIARLLLAELDHNFELTEAIITRSEPLNSLELDLLSAEAWRDTRGRATQLLPAEESDALINYYARLHKLMSFVAGRHRAGDRMLESMSDRTRRMLDEGIDPQTEYLDKMLVAQHETRVLINAYLSRPSMAMGDRLAVAVIQWLARQQRHRRDRSDYS